MTRTPHRGFCTVLIFPGVHGRLRQIRLSIYGVKVLLALCGAGILAVTAFTTVYAHMLLKVSDYNSLWREREALNNQHQRLESAAQQSCVRLGSLESLAGEIGLSYGFGDPLRSRFAPALLAAVAKDESAVGPGYSASLYTFHLLRTRHLQPSADAIDRGVFSDLPFSDATTPSIWPVRGQITARFGQRMDPFTSEDEFHRGVDIAAPPGTPVYAVADGTLIHAGPNRGYGNEVLIDHGFELATMYGHLARIYGRVGERVKRGQLIGTVGMTGRATGAHVHYEVLFHDAPVDPVKYLPG